MMLDIDFDIALALSALLTLALLILDIAGIVIWVKGRRQKKQGEKDTERKILQKAKAVFLRYKFLWLNIFVILLVSWLLYSAFSPAPRILYDRSYPAHEGSWENYFKPIEVVFNVPVDTNSLKPFLSREELTGRWEYVPYLGNPGMTRVARFYPDNSLLPDQRVVLYIVGVKRPWVDEYHEHPLNFFSHTPAEVFSTLPINGMVEIGTDTQIDFTFTKDISPAEEWSFSVEPAFEFTTEITGNRTISLIPTGPLQQSQHYTVLVYRANTVFNLESGETLQSENPELVHRLQFNTIKAPLVKKFSPSGTGVMPDSEIEIMFEVDMDRTSVESTLQITPALEYSLAWFGDRTLSIIPSADLPKETEYVVSFPAGLASKTGGLSDREIRYSFTTIGAVKVSSFSPAN
ncbi:Ig-like domain-containing protein, partial [Candidatus Dojkabacteria bacterium]|nr:Ig-like domain-containing protein [Candidatus Dojkabacteria bacterium]